LPHTVNPVSLVCCLAVFTFKIPS